MTTIPVPVPDPAPDVPPVVVTPTPDPTPTPNPIPETGPGSPTWLVPPTHEEIARLAFQIWRDTGEPEGSAKDNWLEAEQALNKLHGLA